MKQTTSKHSFILSFARVRSLCWSVPRVPLLFFGPGFDDQHLNSLLIFFYFSIRASFERQQQCAHLGCVIEKLEEEKKKDLSSNLSARGWRDPGGAPLRCDSPQQLAASHRPTDRPQPPRRCSCRLDRRCVCHCHAHLAPSIPSTALHRDAPSRSGSRTSPAARCSSLLPLSSARRTATQRHPPMSVRAHRHMR